MPWRKYGTATAAGRAPTDACRGRPPQAMDTGCTDARPPRHSSLRNTLTSNTLQKAAFQTLKGYLLQDKRLPFTRQKVAFYNAKGYLLETPWMQAYTHTLLSALTACKPKSKKL